MDGLFHADPKTKPKIPQKLLDATLDTIRAGIRLEEKEVLLSLSKAGSSKVESEIQIKGRPLKTNQQKKQEKFLKQIQRKTSLEDALPQRNYRAFEDRRMGILLIGDHRRFGGKGRGGGGSGSSTDEEIFYLSAPPLDYSFLIVDNINEIEKENEGPQTTRSSKLPKQSSEGRYYTSSIRLSYNVLINMDGLTDILYKMLEGGPLGLVWLDLCFNCLDSLDVDTLLQIPNVRILYLHGNNIGDMLEIRKLVELHSLRSLTLHGNPIEQDDGYRNYVLYYLPTLVSLDFFGVTRGDRGNTWFGPSYDKYWNKKHIELVDKAKAEKVNQEMSITARMMSDTAEEDLSDGDDGFMMEEEIDLY